MNEPAAQQTAPNEPAPQQHSTPEPTANESAFNESVVNEAAFNEPIPLSTPGPGPAHPEPSSTAGPAPEPESSPEREPIEVEPHTSVEPVAEPYGPSAPAQIAPEAGAPPIPFEPEPSVPEPVSLEPLSPEAPLAVAPEPEAPIEFESEPPVVLASPTEATLALPPTTREVEPPPSVPSAPPPPTGVPVPFAAPPTERSRYFGLKLGLGIGGGAALIGVIVIAVFAAYFVFTNSIVDKVEDTAAEFIGAVAEDDWDTAYAMLCEDYRDRPVDDYLAEWESWDAEGAEVQPMSFNASEVTVEFDDGTAVILYIEIEQTPETLDTSVCGWRTPSGQ